VNLDELEDELIGLHSNAGTSGCGWPKTALSMLSKDRMHQLRLAVETVIQENIPGDLIETGVWRGGACLMMRAILTANQVTDRKIFLADSFCGLPLPNANRYPWDRNDLHHTYEELAVSLDEVKSHFVPDDPQIEFVPGWFKDTLPKLNATFAIIRLDGDMYESTSDALVNLYPKTSIGGFVIIDDWNSVRGCREAVIDFRKSNGIQTPLIAIDRHGVYWRKEA
jgi:O-methyltransferase